MVNTLKTYGFVLMNFKDESYTPAQLINDHSVNELHVGGYTASEMRSPIFSYNPLH